jgi:hypothetical protein
MTILSKSGTWIASVESEIGILLLFIDIICFPDERCFFSVSNSSNSVEIVTSTDNSGNAEFSFPYIELQSDKYLFLSSNTLKLTFTNVIQCDSLQLDVFSCLRILWNDDMMKEYTSY